MNNWTSFIPPDVSSTTGASYINDTKPPSIANSSCPDVDFSNTTLAHISDDLWKVTSPILFLVGIIGNSLSLIILKQLRFWMKPSLFLLVPLALTDITVLCIGLSRYWILTTFEYDIRLISHVGCKINLFLIYISMQFSSWILVCFTFERFLKTNFPFRYLRLMTVKKEAFAVVVIFVLLVFVDGHFFWTNGITDRNGTITMDCTSLTEDIFQFEEKTFVYIDLVVLSVLPAILMIIMNICIIRVLRQSIEYLRTASGNNRAADRHRYSIRVTKMLLFTNSYFLLATLPISVYLIVDSYTKCLGPTVDARKDLARSVLYLLQFSNYTMNFFLYVAANDKFRQHLRSLLRCERADRYDMDSILRCRFVLSWVYVQFESPNIDNFLFS